MSIRRSSGRGKKKSRSSATKSRRSSYIQSSEYLIGEHGEYIEIRDKDGSHVHINKTIPEMFVMADENLIDWDVIVDGRPASYHDFDDHALMYDKLIKMKPHDRDWVETVDIVWSAYLNG